MEMAASEAARAVQRGADRGDAAVLLGDIFAAAGPARRGARALSGGAGARPGASRCAARGSARLAGARATRRGGGAGRAKLLGLTPDDVEAAGGRRQMPRRRRRRRRRADGTATGADPRARPGRPAQTQGDVAVKVGDPGGARSPPTAQRSSSTRDTSRSGSSWAACTSSRKEWAPGGAGTTSRRSKSCRASRRRALRWPICCAAWGGCAMPVTRLGDDAGAGSLRSQGAAAAGPGVARRQAGCGGGSRRSAAPSGSTRIRWKRCSSSASRSPASIATATRWRRGSG